jgi:hypothetical protein
VLARTWLVEGDDTHDPMMSVIEIIANHSEEIAIPKSNSDVIEEAQDLSRAG